MRDSVPPWRKIQGKNFITMELAKNTNWFFLSTREYIKSILLYLSRCSYHNHRILCWWFSKVWSSSNFQKYPINKGVRGREHYFYGPTFSVFIWSTNFKKAKPYILWVLHYGYPWSCVYETYMTYIYALIMIYTACQEHLSMVDNFTNK